MKKLSTMSFVLFLMGALFVFTLSCANKNPEESGIQEPQSQETKNKDTEAAFEVQEITLDESPFFLYIPEPDEMSTYFPFLRFLIALENGEREVNADEIEHLFSQMYNQKTLFSLTFEDFLMNTQDKEVRELVLEYLESHEVQAEFKTALIRRYSSKVESFKREDGRETFRYNYNNEYFDENISLFKLGEVAFFDERLGLLLLQNDWETINYTLEEGNDDSDMFFLMFGGGTNAISMTFGEYSNIEFEDFQKKVINSKAGTKYDNWQVQELPLEGILARANADRIFIGVGNGPDVIEEIQAANANIYLYNSELQKGYEIGYFMNYSEININYPLRVRQWNFLLFNLLFAYIK